jgi:hypothetical protein
MKVKNILFRLKLKGNGIVNFDSNDQRNMFLYTKYKEKMSAEYKNVSYAKKRFYGTDNDQKYKLALSSGFLRHNFFITDVPYQSPNLINNEALLYSFIASPLCLLRGYLEANEVEPLKRSSALKITHAEQTCDAISHIETCSKSGLKNTDKDVTDNSFFKKEVVGKIEYEATGSIDLMQLQFVSCDQIYDRYCFNPDLFKLYKQFLKAKMNTFDSELGYYKQLQADCEIPEYGVKLNDGDIMFLVKYMFTKILEFNRQTGNGGYVKTNKLEYKLVYDAIEDTYDNEDNWVELVTREDVANIAFVPENYYSQIDLDEAITLRAEMVADYKNRKKAKSDKKANIKAEMDEKTEKKQSKKIKNV